MAKTHISTFSSLNKGPCKPCIMQTGNLCPLSPFCGHCYACHSLPLCTRNTTDASEEEKKIPIIGSPYLAICNKALKSLVLQSRLGGCVCNKRKAIIHPSFFFFFWDIVGVYLYSINERKRQADILEITLTRSSRALLEDRILIFNALQLYQLNQISSKGITSIVTYVRCYKCFAEIDHISQEICVGRELNVL